MKDYGKTYVKILLSKNLYPKILLLGFENCTSSIIFSCFLPILGVLRHKPGETKAYIWGGLTPPVLARGVRWRLVSEKKLGRKGNLLWLFWAGRKSSSNNFYLTIIILSAWEATWNENHCAVLCADTENFISVSIFFFWIFFGRQMRFWFFFRNILLVVCFYSFCASNFLKGPKKVLLFFFCELLQKHSALLYFRIERIT